MTVFDDIPESKFIHKSDAFIVIPDGYPVSEGHTLIVSRRSDAVTYFDLSPQEQGELLGLINFVKARLDAEHRPDGYNIGMNCGKAAGQTVMRFHCHVIPRYFGDVKDPRGGVRHSLPGRGNYLVDKQFED
jgi:diadenosine tetraphosphate (Ap4A) HIT family hydrolase